MDSQNGELTTRRERFLHAVSQTKDLILVLLFVVAALVFIIVAQSLGDEAIIIGLSALLFVATEFFFPIRSDDPLATNQKHFWAIMLTIISLVLGFSIKGSLETLRKIESVSAVFGELGNKEIEDEFRKIYVEYHKHFVGGDPVLDGWATRSLAYLRSEMSRGWIPIPRELASVEIGRIYPQARDSIIATNVGSTKFYFTDRIYVLSNTDARDRGVPVIRFYLWGGQQKIELTSDDESKARTIDDFRKEVSRMHEQSGEVYSAVVDTAKLQEVRDILLLDNRFVAETLLSPTWFPIRARATQDGENIRDARLYLRALVGAVDNEDKGVFRMEDKSVKRYFHKYERYKESEDYVKGKLADRLFSDIIRTVIGSL